MMKLRQKLSPTAIILLNPFPNLIFEDKHRLSEPPKGTHKLSYNKYTCKSFRKYLTNKFKKRRRRKKLFN